MTKGLALPPRLLQLSALITTSYRNNWYYAKFKEYTDDFLSAEVYYLRALEADSTHVPLLQEYAHFLSERGRENEAEKFFIRASKIRLLRVRVVVDGER